MMSDNTPVSPLSSSDVVVVDVVAGVRHGEP
jgi:hypothetical protein